MLYYLLFTSFTCKLINKPIPIRANNIEEIW